MKWIPEPETQVGRGRVGSRRLPRPILFLALAAVLFRLLLLLGRGDYLAFDEGWYLLLARSLFTGDGYALVGVPHTALSPLFPILAGTLGVLINSWVWGGRIVAAVASGLLVLPAWAVFRRLAPERTALVASALVAVLPSLAPFTVPFWIGADLWVGAEPLLHLFLYSGLALWLRADEGERLAPWLFPGIALGLAFLARPEAIVTWGLLGLVALGLAAATRWPRRLWGAALMGIGFLLLASPYWLYLHHVSGEWSITGRGVALPTVSADGGPGRSGAARTIERMLWDDDEAYRERLYGLDATGLNLRSDYWGVAPPKGLTAADTPSVSGAFEGAAGPATSDAPEPTAFPGDSGQETAPQAGSPETSGSGPQALAPARPRDPPSAISLYLRALGMVVPLLLWPFVVLGAASPRARRAPGRELAVAGSLMGTSLAIAVVVAVDPRTQLFMVPLLAFYTARGFTVLEEAVQERWPARLSPGFLEIVLAGSAVVWLVGISARRLYLSLSLGSPHHIVAEQNRAVAEELDSLLGTETGAVASWHPALAVYADRDWRVLPLTDLPGLVRYEAAAGAQAMILSAYYPPDLGVENLETRYLVLPVPETDGARRPWALHLVGRDSVRALGRLEPVEPRPPEDPGAP